MFSNFKIDFIFGFSVVDLLYMELIWTRLGHEIDEKNRFKEIGEAFATTHYVSLTTHKRAGKSMYTNHLWGKK
jgi:hypothetical protein